MLNTNTLLQIPFRDYCQKLALALTSNPKTALHSLSLNGNAIEDRGMFSNRIKIIHKKQSALVEIHIVLKMVDVCHVSAQ